MKEIYNNNKKYDIFYDLRSKWKSDIIYRNPGCGRAFGDSLAWASFVANLSLAYNGAVIKVVKPKKLFYKCWNEILDTKNARYEAVRNNNYHKMQSWTRDVYSVPFVPAKILYKPNDVDENLITYQFETKGAWKKKLKDGEEEIIIKKLNDMGYETRPLGKMNSESDNFKLASTCKMFVGICSGMSHFCHAVGTPVTIITNRKPIPTVKPHHINYDVKYYQTYKEFLENI